MNHADLVRELSDQLARLHNRAEALAEKLRLAEADARRWRWFLAECDDMHDGYCCPWAETDSRWDDPQAAIDAVIGSVDAELAREAKASVGSVTLNPDESGQAKEPKP